jgi:hypothetical protein
MSHRDEPNLDRVREALRQHDDRRDEQRRDEEEPRPAPVEPDEDREDREDEED